MKRINTALTFCALAMFVFALSCGHPMALQSITITPTSETVTGPGPDLPLLPVQYTAYGSFIHPTETVDITKYVTWTSDTPVIATVDTSPSPTPGLVTATGNGSCGIVNITATAGKGVVGPGTANAVVYAIATFNVIDTNDPAGSCP